MNIQHPTLPAMIVAAAQRHGARAAIVDGETVIDYARLAHLGRQVARALIHHRVQAGDRVAVWAPNVHEWILAAVGAHMAGAVLVPINTRMKGEEAADILERSHARVLFCIGSFLHTDYPAMLAPLRPATLEHIVVLRQGTGWADFLATADAVPADAVDQRMAALTEASISDLMFTSGTTGRPKAVMSAHGPTLRAFGVWSRIVGLCEDDRYLIVNPFFHSFGYKAGWVAAFQRGATVYPLDVFDAERVMAAIARDRISFLPGPPTLYQTLLAHPKLVQYDLSSLVGAVTGAATVPPVLIERMRLELGLKRVTTAYGLTECGGVATINDPEDTAERIATTCGKVLPGTELRIAGEDGSPLPPGQAGEVLLRGYHIMPGYFEDDAATAASIDADGWLHTGDVGVLDDEGYLRITDRLKDLFIVGGFNCYPAEIERMLAEHPAIAQVAVVGVPDERMGEVGCACVQLRHGSTLTAEALIGWARERMANYKVPRHVLLLDSFPMTASNKVQKRQLTSLVLDRLH